MNDRQDSRLKRKLILPKIMYFFYYGAAAALIPFLVIYYRSVGLPENSIGVLTAIPPLLTLFSAPLWGGLADATQQHRRLLALSIAASLVIVLALSFAQEFLLLALLVAIHAFFLAPAVPFIDSMVLELLGDRKYQYGRLRLWGALGWGMAAPVVGWLAERYGLKWPFLGYLALMAVTLMATLRMPASRASLGNQFWKGMRFLAVNRQWSLFLALALLGGTSMAVTGNFLFLYVNDLDGSRTLMGLALTFATLSELPILFFSDRLIIQFGARNVLVLGLMFFGIRSLAYSFLGNAWPILLIQLLHGPSFAAMWAAGVSYAGEIAPKGMGATAQGMFGAAFMGLGAAVGSLFGGVLYNSIGGAMMYRWAGFTALLGVLLYLLAKRKSMNLVTVTAEEQRM
ncbi:MAG TPA: major facilitator superfamily domain-containing protein 6 [Anaerolineales bacterium]